MLRNMRDTLPFVFTRRTDGHPPAPAPTAETLASRYPYYAPTFKTNCSCFLNIGDRFIIVGHIRNSEYKAPGTCENKSNSCAYENPGIPELQSLDILLFKCGTHMDG